MTEWMILAASGAVLGVPIGFFFGGLYESRYGPTRGKADTYKEMTLRMIPALSKYYTQEYIYWQFIRGDQRPDP